MPSTVFCRGWAKTDNIAMLVKQQGGYKSTCYGWQTMRAGLCRAGYEEILESGTDCFHRSASTRVSISSRYRPSRCLHRFLMSASNLSQALFGKFRGCSMINITETQY